MQEKRRPGRPEGKKPTYRYNLNLDLDLKDFVYNYTWANHSNATNFINDLIRREKDAYFANGGTTAGWISKLTEEEQAELEAYKKGE